MRIELQDKGDWSRKEVKESIRDSSQIEEKVTDIQEDEWIEIVDSDKLRDKTW